MHSRNRLIINRKSQRGTGVTGRTEPKRASATLKNFFRKILKVGLRGGGRYERDRIGIDLMCIVSEITVLAE